MSTSITISFDIDPYNSRRYSKPWGATVTFDGARAKYNFSAGSYLGTDKGGRLIISCNHGDIIARGQKDNRKYRPWNNWYVVQEDGSHRPVNQAEAYDHWVSKG
jgi:hypothetical protein